MHKKMQENKLKRVIGCDLDTSYIIGSKRTRVSCRLMNASNTSPQKTSKNSPKKKKKEEMCEPSVHEYIKSGQSDISNFYGFVSSENEKLKLQRFMTLLETVKTELLKIRNKNCEIISKKKDVHIKIPKLNTGHNYKVWCMFHYKYNCECICSKTDNKNTKFASNENQKIHKEEQSFSVKSDLPEHKKHNIVRYGEYPIKLRHTIDISIPHRMWRIEIVPGEFTEIVNIDTKDSISYDDIIQSHQMSERLQKIVRLPITNRYITFYDIYGMYVFPKESCYVYFGPYSLEEDHCLKVYKKVDKKKFEVPFKDIGSIDFAYKIINLEDLPNTSTNNIEPVKGMWCINCDDFVGDRRKGSHCRVNSVGMLGVEMLNVCNKDGSKNQSYENTNDTTNNIFVHNKDPIEQCNSLVESESLQVLNNSAGHVTKTILKSNYELNNIKQGQLNMNSETPVLKTTHSQQKKSMVKRNTQIYEALKNYEANIIELCIHKKKRLFNGDIKNLGNDSLPRQLFSNISSYNKVLPTMAFLCCTPGIGYIPILEYDETKIVFEDPVDVNRLHQFVDILQASVWLDKYFKSRVQFEENVSLTWRVICGCTKKLFPLNQKLFTDPTLIVTARGITDSAYSKKGYT